MFSQKEFRLSSDLNFYYFQSFTAFFCHLLQVLSDPCLSLACCKIIPEMKIKRDCNKNNIV